MPWSKSRPRGTATDASYHTPEYRATAKRLRDELALDGTGRCAEVVCIKRTRLITPGMDLHVCHERSTGRVLGLGHRACNLSEAARYARSRQTATTLHW